MPFLNIFFLLLFSTECLNKLEIELHVSRYLLLSDKRFYSFEIFLTILQKPFFMLK